jgi:copper transport protein
MRRLTRHGSAALAAAVVLLAVAAPSALAHAELLNTVPARGATVARTPRQAIFQFNQPVGGTLGAVKVYNAHGDEVDDHDVGHSGGRQSWMGVGLPAHLPDGTYVATYRVISADTHVVYGGNTFSIGALGSSPVISVGTLIARNRSGSVTEVAFGAVKALDYATMALWVGVLAFLGFVWLPELRADAGGDEAWAAASRAFGRSAGRLLWLAVVGGVIVSALGLVLQGATAGGISFWSALDGHVVDTVIHSRFGWVWGIRGLVWLGLGGLLALASVGRREPVPALRPVALGADGLALEPAPGRAITGATILGSAYLVVTPALSGHASVGAHTGILFPLDVAHVTAMCVWLGGLVCLIGALPPATRRLEAGDRTRLLAGTLVRFSPIALACVLTLLVSGVVQAYLHIWTWDGLFDSAYGVAVLVKFGLLMALVGLGALNRRRAIPGLRAAVRTGRSPGEIGVALRRTLRAEVALVLIVLGVTGALVGYTPPTDAASGPFAATTSLGPAQLEIDVDPARVGPNTIHLYLINPKDGSQFTETKELDVQASLPSKGIGPLTLNAQPAGPGHYVIPTAELVPGGTWHLRLTDRVSEFDEYLQTVKVPIH